MWFDPDADCGGQPCAQVCNVSRADPMPPACLGAVRTGNPLNPWDFNDSDEGNATKIDISH